MYSRISCLLASRFLALILEGGGGGGGGGGEDNLFPEGSFGVFIRFAIWKMSDGANAMVRLYRL